MDAIGKTDIISDNEIKYISVMKLENHKIKVFVLKNGKRILDKDDVDNYFGGRD